MAVPVYIPTRLFIRVPISPHSSQYRLFSDFFKKIIAILLVVKWYFIVVLVDISLLTNDVAFMCFLSHLCIIFGKISMQILHPFLIFFKRLYLFICFCERGRKGEKEGEKYRLVASRIPPTRNLACNQACTLTGNQTSDLTIHRPVLNPLSYTSQGKRHLNLNPCPALTSSVTLEAIYSISARYCSR